MPARNRPSYSIHLGHPWQWWMDGRARAGWRVPSALLRVPVHAEPLLGVTPWPRNHESGTAIRPATQRRRPLSTVLRMAGLSWGGVPPGSEAQRYRSTEVRKYRGRAGSMSIHLRYAGTRRAEARPVQPKSNPTISKFESLLQLVRVATVPGYISGPSAIQILPISRVVASKPRVCLGQGNPQPAQHTEGLDVSRL